MNQNRCDNGHASLHISPTVMSVEMISNSNLRSMNKMNRNDILILTEREGGCQSHNTRSD